MIEYIKLKNWDKRKKNRKEKWLKKKLSSDNILIYIMWKIEAEKK